MELGEDEKFVGIKPRDKEPPALPLESFSCIQNCAEDGNGASTHSNGSQSEHNPI